MPILDKYGRQMRSKSTPKRPLPAAPILKSQRDYVAQGLTPEKVAPIFREADRGNVSRQAQLFEQLREHDAHVLSEDDKRRNAITSQYLDWQITPASDSQRDLDVVNFLEKYVLDHDDWIKYKRAQQTAVGQGFAGLSPEWDRSSGQAVVVNFSMVEHKRLIFQDPQTGFLRDWPLLATDEHPQGEEIHQRALFLHKHCGLSGNAAKSGVFRPVTWMMVFKHFAIKDWWVFSELCGIPLRIGYYNSSTSTEDRKTLEQALYNVGVDFAALISDGTRIEFQDAAKNVSGADLWEKQANFTNNEISKAIVGSSAFSEAGKSGSYALHTLETGVRADLTLADAQESAATDLDQWIAPLVGINFGWDTPLPKFRAVLKKQEDLKTKSEWLEPVADRVGDQMPLNWYLEQYGIPQLQPDDRTVGGAKQDPTDNEIQAAKLLLAKAGGPTPEQTATRNAKRIDALADTTLEMVRPDFAANEKKILQMIENADSEEAMYSGLADLYPQLTMQELEKILAQAMLAAFAEGIRTVQNESA